MELMKTTWIRAFLGLTLLISGLHATDLQQNQLINESEIQLSQENDTESRVPVGERRLSHEEHMATQEKRSLLAEERVSEYEEAALADSEDESLLKPRSFTDQDDIVSKGLYTSHEGAFHRPISVTLNGDMVTLEDGSMWKVRIKDRYKTLDWLAGDSIIILPNHSWFSSYYYVLLNQNTGSEVRVNLTLGPIYNGIYTHWIVAIDYYNEEMCLEDGTIWSISGSDYSTMKKWLVNDTIIIGVNDSWFSSKPNILINVNTLTYAAAICEN
jgi:hypothetical protein